MDADKTCTATFAPAPVGPVLTSGTLYWGEAVTRTDGSPVTNLASFNVYMSSTSGGPRTKVATVPAPSPTPGAGATYSWVITGLAAGQKYATVTAVDQAGIETGPSTELPFFWNVSGAPRRPAPKRMPKPARAR